MGGYTNAGVVCVRQGHLLLLSLMLLEGGEEVELRSTHFDA